MRRSSRLGRILVLTCSAGLVSTVAMLPSGSAFALVSGTFFTEGQASSSPTSGNTCTLISGDATPSSSTKAVVGGKVTTSVTMDATFQSNTDVNDLTAVTGHYTGVVNVKKSHGDLSRMTITGSGNVSIARGEGSASHCRTTADLIAEIQPMSFTESHSGWLLAHRSSTAKAQIAVLEAASTGPSGGAIIDESEGGAGSADERAFVSAGDFGAIAAVGTTAGGILLKTANQTSFSLAFFRAGAAPAAVSGSGKQFVRFPASVSCSSHSARLTWTSKAGRVAGGSFSVNGSKKASVSHPHGGGHVTLHHLSATADNTIVAHLSLKGGGHATAARAYLPCKG